MLYFACPARTPWRVRSCRYAAPLSFFSSFLGFPARTHSRYSSMSLRAMYLSFIGFLSIHEHPPSCQHAMPLHIGEAIGHEVVVSLLTPEDTRLVKEAKTHVYAGMSASARNDSTVYALLAARSHPCVRLSLPVVGHGVRRTDGRWYAVVKEQ